MFNSFSEKRRSAPEGVSPAQWWTLTDYRLDDKLVRRIERKIKLEGGDMKATEPFNSTEHPMASSDDPAITRTKANENQDNKSVDILDTISASDSELQSVRASNKNNESVAHPETIST